MKIQALSLGAVLGFLVAVVPSCGTPTTCGPASCSGCCDSAGKCVPSASVSSTACGVQGVACVNCMASSKTCSTSTYQCVDTAGTGGGSGGSCGPSNCTGCCDSTGACVPASASGGDATCGTGGLACTNCTATGRVCDTGTKTCVAGSTGGGSGGGSGGGTGTCNPVAQTGCATGEACMVTNPDPQATTVECFKGECDTVQQNCPNANDKCSYGPLTDGGVGRRCFAAGTATEGQACERNGTAPQDTCAEGLLCVANQGGAQTCRKMCYSGSNCASGSQCIGIARPNGQAAYQLLCTVTPPCDVLAQDCTSGQACYILPDSSTTCFPAGTIPVDGNCNSGGLCVKGAMCIGGACKNLCNTDGGTPNCGSATCQQLATTSGDPLPFGACP